MAKSSFKNAKIKGISLVVGENQFTIDDYPFLYNNNEQYLKRLKNLIGVNKHYYTSPQTTAMDLGKKASLILFNDLNIDVNTVDAILCVSQTPDYLTPGNASLLHKELDLTQDCLTQDINAACSGYILGLHQAFMLVNSGYKRVLLVAGDTFTKLINPKDKINAILFGDGVSATIIDYNKDASESYFMFKSNGSGFNLLYLKAGGARCPLSDETKIEQEQKDGSIRSDSQLYMNGFDVFNFTLNEQPKMISDILSYASKNIEHIDHFVFHQANKHIVNTIADNANLPSEKISIKAFSQYGNLTSASIPSALCYELKDDLTNNKKILLLQGFGLGLSWGACVLEFDNVSFVKIENYK